MSDEYIEVNGVRYRREGPPRASDATEYRAIGDILSEAAMTAPKGKAMISSLSGPMDRPMNPYATPCLGCGHTLIEVNCPMHGSGGDYLYYPASNPPGHLHRKCLDSLLAQRTRELQEQAQDQ
jgi:hypothetical protein